MFLSGFLSNYRDIEIPIDDIIQAYTNWVQEHRYMVLERLKPTWDAPKSLTMFEKETIAVKSAKRGMMFILVGLSQDSECSRISSHISTHLFRQGKMRTQVLFITLTYDTKLRFQHQAWKTFSKFHNLFMSKMRRVFGSIFSACTLESFENGQGDMTNSSCCTCCTALGKGRKRRYALGYLIVSSIFHGSS